MQSPDQLRYLLQQYLEDKTTEEERLQLFMELQRPDVDWEELLLQVALQQEKDPQYRESDWTAVIAQIVQQPARKQKVYFLQRWWMAAAILLFVVFGLWLVVHQNNVKPASTTPTPIADVLPGKQGAI